MALWITKLSYLRGRWLGRKDATVAGARGIPSYEARRILAGRASELRGVKLEGFWIGVQEIRPEWGMSLPSKLTADPQPEQPPS